MEDGGHDRRAQVTLIPRLRCFVHFSQSIRGFNANVVSYTSRCSFAGLIVYHVAEGRFIPVGQTSVFMFMRVRRISEEWHVVPTTAMEVADANVRAR